MFYQNQQDVDTREGIFKRLFHVRVPYVQMMTIEELEHFGMPISGDPMRDRETANELREVMISINAMVEYWKRGAQVYIVKMSDTPIIYQLITAHLTAWKEALMHELNLDEIPLEDLRDLDEFANSIYEHAKWQFKSEFDKYYALRSKTYAGQQAMGNLRRRVASVGNGDLSPRRPNGSREEPKFEPRKGFKEDFKPADWRSAQAAINNSIEKPTEEVGGRSRKSLSFLLRGGS